MHVQNGPLLPAPCCALLMYTSGHTYFTPFRHPYKWNDRCGRADTDAHTSCSIERSTEETAGNRNNGKENKEKATINAFQMFRRKNTKSALCVISYFEQAVSLGTRRIVNMWVTLRQRRAWHWTGAEVLHDDGGSKGENAWIREMPFIRASARENRRFIEPQPSGTLYITTVPCFGRFYIEGLGFRVYLASNIRCLSDFNFAVF